MLQIVIAGRLTKDSELRFTGTGKPVLGFTVATDVGWGDNKHGVFIKSTVWGDRAEKLHPYLSKGTNVTVIGEGDLEQWDTEKSSGAVISCNVRELTLQGGGQATPAQPEKPSQSGFRKTENPAPDFQDDVDF